MENEIKQHALTNGLGDSYQVTDAGGPDVSTHTFEGARLTDQRLVPRERARAEWRRLKSLGWTEENEVDEDPGIDEEALYEAMVDAQMSRIYACEPDWAI